MLIYESCCIYTNLDVYITVLSGKFMILLFCPFLTSIVKLNLSNVTIFRETFNGHGLRQSTV